MPDYKAYKDKAKVYYTAAKNKFQHLPMPVKIGLGAGALYLVYKIIKGSNAQEQTNAAIQKQTEKELAAFLKKQKLSFAPSQYLSFANAIYEGVKYGIGDNYGAVKDILMKMNNNADVLALRNAYSSRQHYVFGVPVGEKKDLFTAVRSELGSEYGFYSGKLQDINDDWAKKKIAYRL